MMRVMRYAFVVGAAVAITGCDSQSFVDPGPGGGPFMQIQPPNYGPTVQQANPPAPISGGTLLVTRDGQTAVAADPERDTVAFVSLSPPSVRALATLQPGDEPGRVVEDGAGRIHVALRGGQSLLTLDASGKTIARRSVCAVPRGVAWQSDGDLIHVACAGGELVSFPAAGGAATRTLKLDRDLRDVIVDGNHLLVSRFKTAELLVVESDGTVSSRMTPAEFASQGVRPTGDPSDPMSHFSASTAWRTVAHPAGGAIMLHQRGLMGTVNVIPNPQPGQSSYGSNSNDGNGGGSCNDAIVHTTLTRMGTNGTQQSPSPVISGAVVAVDAAIAPDGKHIAIASAGSYKNSTPSVFVVATSGFGSDNPSCVTPRGSAVGGQVTAVAWAGGTVIAQTRESPALVSIDDAGNVTQLVTLPGASREDTGHAIFHADSGAGIACASCHPEGGEDGRTWTFSNSGKRRTQSLRGGVMETAPFHWDGDMANLSRIVDVVFVGRMAGPNLDGGQRSALTGWLGRVPALPLSPATDAVAVERGRQLFQDPVVGCATCHNGAKLTDDLNHDVGTGGSFQVPSLRGVAWRAPFLHDGCAKTLADRFGDACRGTAHGSTEQLSPSQIGDLITYLETL